MSFLSYVGKTLGAGTAPIQNAIQTSTMEQMADEWKRERGNRENAAARAEAKAADEEAERQRLLTERQTAPGLAPPVTPMVDAATLPTTVPPMVRAPTAPPTGLNVPATPAATTGEGYTDMRSLPSAPTPAASATPATTGELSPLAERMLSFMFGKVPTREEALERLDKEITSFDEKIKGAYTSPRTGVPDPTTARLVKERQSLVDIRNEIAPPPPPERYFLGQELDAAAAPAGLNVPATAPAATAPAATAPAATAPAPTAGPAGAMATLSGAGAERFMPVVNKYASLFSIPPEVAAPAIAMLAGGESANFDLNAKNGQHLGAFQFNKPNQQKYNEKLKAYGLDLTTAEGQTLAAMMLMDDNAKALKNKNVPVTAMNLVMAHNQGAAGLAALVNNPDMNAAEALDQFAPMSNQSGKARVSGQAWMKGKNVSSATASDFVEGMQAYYGAYSPEYTGKPGFDINPDVYLADPNRLTFDMERIMFRDNQLRMRAEETMRLADRTNTAEYNAALKEARAIEDQRFELQGAFAKLEMTKGLAQAASGDTRYISAVLSGAMGQSFEVTPYTTDAGIAFQVTAGGVPVTGYIDYNNLKQFSARMVDSELDAQLRTLEIERDTKIGEVGAQLQADLILLASKGELDVALTRLKSQLDTARERAGLPPITAVDTTASGELVVYDASGKLYTVGDVTEKIGGKSTTYTGLVEVVTPGLRTK